MGLARADVEDGCYALVREVCDRYGVPLVPDDTTTMTTALTSAALADVAALERAGLADDRGRPPDPVTREMSP